MAKRFNKEENITRRDMYVDGLLQRAYSNSCHANWMGDKLDILGEEVKKMNDETAKNKEEIKTLEEAIDHHTVENRSKRKALEGRNEEILAGTQRVVKEYQQFYQQMMQLYASVEADLDLADYAAKWEWKENEPAEVAIEKPKSQVYVLQKDWSDRKAADTVNAADLGDGVIYKDLIADGTIVEEK